MRNLSFYFSLLALFFINAIKAQNLQFAHYGLPEGLPQETIHCIDKDQYGFIWLGTSDGVVRYDGHDFFVPQPDDASNLDIAGYRIGAIKAIDNHIYIGTSQNGLISYQIDTETITQLGEPNTNCTRIIAYKNQTIAAFYNQGLALIDSFQTFHQYVLKGEIPQKIIGIAKLNNEVYVASEDGIIYSVKILKDENSYGFIYDKLLETGIAINNMHALDNKIWISTDDGVFWYNAKSNTLSKIDILEGNETLSYNTNTLAFYNDRYYIGTTSDGLLVTSFDQENLKVLAHYKADKKYDPSTINSDGINELFISDDLLFIGNINLDITSIKNQDVFSRPTDQYDLDNPSVFAVCDTETYLFTGSSSGLIISSNNDSSEYNILKEFNRIRGITKDDDNNIWFVTNKGVFVIPLNSLNIQNPLIYAMPINADNAAMLPAENMRSVYKDRNGIIWITTFNAGFAKFTGSIASADFRFKNYASDKLASVFTLSMVEDTSGNYWMSTQKGLSKLTFDNDDLVAVKNYDESSGLATRGVLSSFVDQKGVLWVASRKGLNKYNSNTDTFTSYGKREGLSNTFVYNINADNFGNLWLSTNGGLFRFNPEKEEFANYNPKDGVQSTEFNLGACYKNETNGNLYFGGINGLNIFDPSRISELDRDGDLRFTSLKIKDDYVLPNYSEVLENSISTTSTINLKYDDFPVNLNFASLDFRPNNNSTYVYKLLPDDSNWNNLNGKNDIQLLNLSAKSYTLQIQGKSRNDFWNKAPLELQINVSPPWYKSKLAYLIYALLIATSIYVYYRINLRQKLAAQEARRLQDLDELKSRFITNITHEFRTPLTIILGYINRLKESNKEDSNLTSTLDTVQKNSTNLLSLVNQMLDLAKLEQGRLDLNWVNIDVVKFVDNVVSSFQSIASEKDIQLDFTSDETVFYTDTDAEKFRQILTNLIGNAIKFSPNSTRISVNLKTGSNTWVVTVKDEGFGIEAEALEHIFERFYQVNSASQKSAQGTGIGLALTKELTELLNGEIAVQSVENKGTTFSLKFKRQEQADRVDQMLQNKIPTASKTHVLPLISSFEDDSDFNVLLVEDNKDMATYIASCIQDQFNITFAENGKIGLEKATSLLPDIIVTDVMMPVMDGLEFTSLVQQQEVTNHIPVIMLTSKAMQEDKMSGLSAGADAYLTKPFQKDELLLRMQSLVSKRETLRRKYQNTAISEVTEIAQPTKEDLFIEKVIQVIDDHLDNSDFNATTLASQLAISESQLYRKLKAITNKSTAIFIRQIRLERANKMLSDGQLTVSEVAYAVGFNDPKWFSKTFKETFGISPSSLIK